MPREGRENEVSVGDGDSPPLTQLVCLRGSNFSSLQNKWPVKTEIPGRRRLGFRRSGGAVRSQAEELCRLRPWGTRY